MTNPRSVAIAAAALLLAAGLPAAAAGLQINSLGTTNAVAIEHQPVTGDDRGGIAVGTNLVIYNGDGNAGRFARADLTAGTNLGIQLDAITSDIGSGVIWSLGSNATTALPYGGGTATHLLRHDGATGLLDGTAIALSVPVALSNSGNVAGLFAGNGAIAVVDGNTRSISQIDTATGQVTVLGTVELAAWDSASNCENWALWGVFEEFGGAKYLAYVQSESAIVRYRISDGNVSTVASFAPPGLSDACSFTVSPATNRWYVHYEGTGIFRSGDETLAVADMSGSLVTIAVGPASLPPPQVGVSYQQTITAIGGTGTYTFSVIAGALPPELTLGPSSGVISGTPTVAGPYAFTVNVADDAGGSGQRAYTMQVAPPALTAVPTLSEWGLVVLSLLAALAAAVTMRRRA